MQQNGNGASDAIGIVSLHATNFRRLSLARVKIDKTAGLVRITGLNQQGKTSLLQIVPDTLLGGRAIDGTPLREGARQGKSGVGLSNGWTIDRLYDDDKNPKGRLVVKAADGSTKNQTELNALLGATQANPFALFNKPAKDRQQVYLSLASDPELPQKLAQLRGRRTELEDERSPHIATVRGRKGIIEPAGARPEPVDTQAEMERLWGLENLQKERDKKIAQRLGAPDKDGTLQGGLHQRIEKGRAAVAELEKRLAEARALLAKLEGADAMLEDEIDAMPDHTAEIEAIRGRLASARVIEQQLAPWVAYDEAMANVEHSEAEKKRLDDEVKAVNAAINRLLSETNVPVPGLTFNEAGEPLLNGRPEADWSGRERVDVAVDVAFALNPRLKLVLLDEEANALDPSSLAHLDARATAQGFLVLAVRIGLEGAGEIVVDDGVALNRDESPAAVRAAVADEQAEQDALAGQAEQDAAAAAEARYEQERAAPDLFEIEQLPGSADF